MKHFAVCLLFVCAARNLPGDVAARYLVTTKGHAPRVATHLRVFETIGGYAVDLTDREAGSLRGSRDVVAVERVGTIHLLEAVPTLNPGTDGVRPEQSQVRPYGIDAVNAPAVWPFTKGGGAVHVAILDTGIDMGHPDLIGRYAGGFNAFTGGEPIDDNGHGTHVAGTIAGSDNSIGVVGVAPEANIWAVKVLSAVGTGTDETLLEGIDWVIRTKREIGGQWIVNLSLAMERPNTLAHAAFDRLEHEGIMVFAAAGNDSWGAVDYPAGYTSVIAVGASGEDGARAAFSNYGSGLALLAPGVGILSTSPLGLASVADVTTMDGLQLSASALLGSPKKDVRASLVYCGFGRSGDFPREVIGRIAVIERGEVEFPDMALNAKSAGAAALIIINDEHAPEWPWSLIASADDAFAWPLTIAVSAADGARLLQRSPGDDVVVSYRNADYAKRDGTSMATPHVAGVAALIWSLAPHASAGAVRMALLISARDLGVRGYDEQSGFGSVDALAAANYLAPAALGLETPPAIPKRRAAR